MVADMQDMIGTLQALYMDALVDASENFDGGVQKITTAESGVKYQLKGYSQHQIDNWASSKSIVVYENERQLRQFISDARSGTNLSKKMYFGAITADLAARIKKDTGLDVDRYNCTLRASEIRKIFADHGNEKTEAPRGQRAIEEDDIVAIPQIIQSPDEIRLSDKLFEGKPVIEFAKTINGKTTVAAYVSAKHLDLTVQTMYSGKNKGNLATAAGDQAPANTPEAHDGTVPTPSIRNPNEVVNKKFSMRDKALEHFGRTFSWKETGYLLTNGAKLDFSGRHEGASGGYRTVDHRDILNIYPEDTELDGNGAMVDFMSQGNIRIMPEGNGINLSVKPTKSQEQALDDFISRARGEVTLDIDDDKGNTVVSVEYPRLTRASKVIQDIRNYFETGAKPVVSSLAQFRYSQRDGDRQGVMEALEKENAKLKEDVTELRELVKLQRQQTHGTKFTKTSVEAAARLLKQSANAKGSTQELSGLLNGLYEYIASTKELTWEGVKEQAQGAVDWLWEHIDRRGKPTEYAQDILNQLHGSKVRLDESQMAEAEYRFGSYVRRGGGVLVQVSAWGRGGNGMDLIQQRCGTSPGQGGAADIQTVTVQGVHGGGCPSGDGIILHHRGSYGQIQGVLG